MRPPGMKRAMRMMYAPRSSSVFSAHSRRLCHFALPKTRLTVFSPTKCPIQNEMLSPMIAPAAAERMTSHSTRSPELARFPPRTTSVSEGTSGKNASTTATAKMTR